MRIPVKLNFNKLGHITKVVIPDPSTLLTHGIELIQIPEDELAHYGVPGMKWGKRKSGSSVTVAKSADKEEYDALKKRPTSSLSNKELQKVNERLQLEKKYSELKTNDAAVKTGYKAIKGVIGVAGTAAAVYALAQNPLVKDLRKIIG